jgi:hypothetical protein
MVGASQTGQGFFDCERSAILKWIVPAVAALVLTAGCLAPNVTPTLQWSKPGATKSDFNRDRCGCALEAEGQFSKTRSSADGEAAMAGDQVDNQGALSACMHARGWTLERKRGYQYPEDCRLTPMYR